MSEPVLTTLLSSGAGARVGNWYTLAIDEEDRGEEKVVPIHITSPSWNAADVTIEETFDPSASPEETSTVQVASGTAMVNLVIEANSNVPYLATPGVAFRIRVADAGSPETVVKATSLAPLALAL